MFFPVNFAKLLRTSFQWNTSGRLRLQFVRNSKDTAWKYFHRKLHCLGQGKSLQKQPQEVFYENNLFFKILQNLQKNFLCQKTLLLRKRLWHRCFPVNFVKVLRTPFSQNTSGWLLLSLRDQLISSFKLFHKKIRFRILSLVKRIIFIVSVFNIIW